MPDRLSETSQKWMEVEFSFRTLLKVENQEMILNPETDRSVFS
ncbi:MAG: hypothetical protein WC220_11815 [Pedobacter sp.]|jgi:hypothetical protein